MAVKINLTKITKNHAADPEIRFLAKSNSTSNGYAKAMPTAWELRLHCTRKIGLPTKLLKYLQSQLVHGFL